MSDLPHDGVKSSIISTKADRDERGYADTVDSRASDSDGVFHPDIEPDFRPIEPWFKEEINPWASTQFAQASHTEWLNRKRDACKKDLDALKQLLEKVASTPYEKRKAAFESVLRQASGALAELHHIDELLAALNPSHKPAALDPVFVARIPPAKPKKASYYLGAFYRAA